MIRKQHSFIADIEKVLVVCIESQTSYNIPLSQSLVQSKALLFLLWRLRKVKKLQKKSLKPTDVGLWGLRKEAVSKHQSAGEAAGADVEAAQSYLEDLGKMLH